MVEEDVKKREPDSGSGTAAEVKVAEATEEATTVAATVAATVEVRVVAARVQ